MSVGVVRIRVRLTPRGGRDSIDGWQNGELRVRVSAPAIDGRANEALVRLLARALDVAPKRIAILRGEKSRSKELAIEGLGRAEAERRLGRPSGPDG